MATSTPGRMEIAFAIDRLCDKADDGFRLAMLLTGDSRVAKDCLKKAFEAAAIDIKRMALPERIEYFLAHHVWRAFNALKNKQDQAMPAASSKDDGALQKTMALSAEQRAIIGVMDIFCLDHTSAASCLALDLQKLKDQLADARKKII